MIEIRINGESLDLPEDISISMKEENSFFTQDSIPSPFVFKFQLPGTPKNNRLTGFPNKVANKNKFRIEVGQADVVAYGIPVYRCNLFVMNSRTDITVQLASITNEYGAIKETSIRSLSYPSIDLGSNILTTMLASTADTVDSRPYVFAPVKNVGLINGNITEFVNAYDQNTNAFAGAGAPADHSICPFFYVRYVMDKIFDLAGLTARGDFYNHPEIKSLVFYNAAIKLLSYSTLTQREVIPGKHLPDISVSELLNTFKQFWRLGFFFDLLNPGHIRIKTFSEVYNSKEEVDLTPFVTLVDISFDEFNEHGYTLTQKRAGEDEKLAKPNLTYQFEDGVNEEEFNFDYPFTAIAAIATMPPAFNQKSPQVEQDITDQEFAINFPTPSDPNYRIASFSPRFMFYRGMFPGTTSDYPFLGVDENDSAATDTFDFSLAWAGDKGLFNLFHKDYFNMVFGTKGGTISLYLPLHIAIQLQLDKKVRIRESRFLIVSKDSTYSTKFSGRVLVKLNLYLIV